jgi:hypothetical protein
MEFTEGLGLAGVGFIALIAGLIQAAKRFVPGAHDNLWFGLSLVLGLGLQVTFWFATLGVPANFLEWFSLVILGLSFGLSSGKAYDEQKARRNGA